MVMTSHRPYMIRALNEWILENNCTPYILVNAFEKDVQVPQHYVKDGQIVLNISPAAVQDMHITNEAVSFNGRFGGIPTEVYVPTAAIMGIYARENGQGMIFDPDEPVPEPPAPGTGDARRAGDSRKKDRPKRPALRIIKS